MPEIRILSDKVANQIAAGEVVERPMSVIKELLENAIDAEATRISIEFRNGGKSFMSIEDNGCGMTADQALLALERHATSKIRETADLDTIHSFGFRGEALPSIASVSCFSLRTRTPEADFGSEILVEGGKYLHCREIGMPAGTRIEISRLFFNVPARLKFLKSENTEAAHITRCVRLYAVAHPGIAFTLAENGREIFRSPAGTDLRERVAAIWGNQLADDLIPLCENEREGMKISGLVGRPGVSRSARTEMVTIVNGRPVDNRTMAYSLVESYHTLIPRGRYPLAFLFLEIDPHAVDVNVHPAKREVRFRNESAVRNLIISAVLKTVGGNDAAAEISDKPIPRENLPEHANFSREEKKPGTKFASREDFSENDFDRNSEKLSAVPARISAAHRDFPAREKFRGVPAGDGSRENFSANSGVPFPRKIAESPENSVPAPRENFPAKRVPAANPHFPQQSAWRFIGAAGFDGLLLFQVGKSLFLFSSRLALQRIWFERALNRFRNAERFSQPLLIPEPIEFEPILSDALLRNKATLDEAGFAIEEFGRNFFRITEVPDWLEPDTDVKAFVRDLVDRIARLPAEFSRGKVAHETLAKIAADQATRQKNAFAENGDYREILSALFETSQPNVSPNGQKIFFEISRAEIARRFL